VWDKEVWPPSSPDCRPLDYFVTGVSESSVTASPHNNTAALIKKTKELMGSLDRDIMARACRRRRSRIKVVVATDSTIIE